MDKRLKQLPSIPVAQRQTHGPALVGTLPVSTYGFAPVLIFCLGSPFVIILALLFPAWPLYLRILTITLWCLLSISLFVQINAISNLKEAELDRERLEPPEGAFRVKVIYAECYVRGEPETYMDRGFTWVANSELHFKGYKTSFDLPLELCSDTSLMRNDYDLFIKPALIKIEWNAEDSLESIVLEPIKSRPKEDQVGVAEQLEHELNIARNVPAKTVSSSLPLKSSLFKLPSYGKDCITSWDKIIAGILAIVVTMLVLIIEHQCPKPYSSILGGFASVAGLMTYLNYLSLVRRQRTLRSK